MEKLSTVTIPEEIELEDHLFDLKFSPIEPKFSVCSVNGKVYEYFLDFKA